MRSKIKSVLSIFLVLIMVVSIFPVIGIQPDASASCGRTESDAVNWANSQIGKSLNYDGAYGAQCVDLTMYYYCYLNYHAVRGNGCDYATNEKPGTWQRIKYTAGTGFVARPGDIAVWTYTTSAYGHVAIVTSADTNGMNVVEQNSSTGVRAHYYSYSYGTFWGVIRPDFEKNVSVISVDGLKIGEVEDLKFTAFVHTTSSVGISSVRYAVWTIDVPYDGVNQDDLVWYNGYCTDGNDIYWAYIPFSEHKNQLDVTYAVHAYITDNNGNQKVEALYQYIPKEGPSISNVNISDVNETGFTVSCDVIDNGIGINRVQFPTWTTTNGQDDLPSEWQNNPICKGIKSGNTYSFRVNISKHNNEYGEYNIHIYAYDEIGKITKYTLKWNYQKYNINYYAPDGTNVPKQQTKYNNVSVNLSSIIPTRSGYTFKEWNTKADGTGTAYKPNETYTQNANLTLYAIWTLNHKHSYTSKITKQPSCTATGVKTFTCSCGDTYTETISALGHDFGEWVVTKPATTTETGVETRYCSRCTAYETRTIPKLTDQTVELNNHNITMNYKATTQLVASNKNVEWTSSNTKVATVDSNGKVTATGTGNVVIKATIKGTDISDSCQISVSYAWWQWIIEILLLGFLWY